MKNKSLFSIAGLALVCLAACGPSTPEELLAGAEAAIQSGEWRTAEIHLKNLLQKDGEHARGRLLLGQVALTQGDYVGAELNLRRAADLGVDRAAVRLPLMRALLARGEFQRVLSESAAGDVRAEDRADALAVVATAHRRLGNLEQAEAAFRQALELEPGSKDLRIEIANVRLAAGDADAARQGVNELLAEDPEFVPALVLRGALETQGRDLAAAENTFATAIRIAEGRAQTAAALTARMLLAENRLAQNKIDAAAADAALLLEREPSNPAVRLLMAKIEAARNDLDAARRRLSPLVAEYPTYWPAFALLGRVLAAQGNVGQAEMHLRTAVVNDPGDAGAVLSLVELLIRGGKIDEARDVIARARPNDRARPMFLALAARASLQGGEAGLASELFAQSEQQSSPQSMQELLQVSSVFAASGEIDRAIRLIEESDFEGAESDVLADYFLALLRLEQRDFAGAAVNAAKVAERLPSVAWPVNLQGTVALLGGDSAAALAHFARALEIAPSDVAALLNSARAAYVAGDLSGAEGFLRRTVEQDGQNVTALRALATLAVNRSDLAAARGWVERLPDPADRWLALGELAGLEGRHGEAADAFKASFDAKPSLQAALLAASARTRAGQAQPDALLLKWAADNPGNPDAEFALGSMALNRGELDAAIKRFETVVEKSPSHAAALNNLAWLYGERGDSRALGIAERAHAAAPDNAQITDTLGWLLVQAGEAARGAALLEKAAAQLPELGDVRYHWAAALAATGDKRRARKVLDELLASGAQFSGRDEARALAASLAAD